VKNNNFEVMHIVLTRRYN